MQTPDASVPRRTRLVVAVVLVAMGFTFLAPTRLDIAILLRNIMQGIGVTSLAAGGLISTATLIGDGITEPFLGRLSDRWSRRLSLSLGIALFSFFTLLTALAANFTSMLIVRVLLGIGQAMFIPAYFAFLGGAFGRHRGLVLGSLAGLFTVGAAINPLLTKALFDAGHTWQTPFWYYGVFGLLLAGAVGLVGRGGVYELNRVPSRNLPALSLGGLPPSMFLLLITMVFWGLSQYGYLGIYVTYLRTIHHFSLGAAAGVASIASWTSFGFSFLGGWLSDRIGRRTSLLIYGLISLGMSIPLFQWANSFWSATVFAAIFQAANGMFYPLGVAYAQDMAEAHRLGWHSGMVSGTGHIMAGLSGLIVGAFAGALGFASIGWVFVVASAIMVVAIYFTRDPRSVVVTAQAQSSEPAAT
ncbi:MAG: MFS transporter [Firmicutes bacterium]|nr:MFS transporter [Bacillota bacterium]